MARGDPSGLFAPETIAAGASIEDVIAWVTRIQEQIAAAFEFGLIRNVEFLNVPPDKPREGMIRGADGVNWNPGAGRGVYEFHAGAWHFLFTDTGVGIISTTNLADNAVTNPKMADNAVGSAEIQDSAVLTQKLADAAVATAKLADLAVVTAKLGDLSVVTGKLADLGVTTAKMNDLAVTTGKLADLGVTATKIADDAVTTPKLIAGAVTAAKITAHTITANEIAGHTITAAEIAALTITAAEIAANTITAAKIAGHTITAAEIAALTITAAEIAASTITAAKLNIAQLSAISADVGDITAGSIRGVNVNAASHTTKGSYLTGALFGGESTINVRRTDDFSSSGGTAVVFDLVNDQDQITYTGKTATTLTGCSGVLVHNNGATIIPLAKSMAIDAAVNELRALGDRGDGTIEQLIALGANASIGSIAILGSANTSWNALVGTSGSNNAIVGVASDSTSAGVVGTTSSSGTGVSGTAVSGNGGKFGGNSTKGNLLLPNANGSTFPTDKTIRQLAQVGDRLYYSDGTHWYPLTYPLFISSEQTITVSSVANLTHGLTDGAGNNRNPGANVAAAIICKTAELGYSVGDIIVMDMGLAQAGGHYGIGVYSDATTVNLVFGTSGIIILRRDAGVVGNTSVITTANWKAIALAW